MDSQSNKTLYETHLFFAIYFVNRITTLFVQQTTVKKMLIMWSFKRVQEVNSVWRAFKKIIIRRKLKHHQLNLCIVLTWTQHICGPLSWLTVNIAVIASSNIKLLYPVTRPHARLYREMNFHPEPNCSSSTEGQYTWSVYLWKPL